MARQAMAATNSTGIATADPTAIPLSPSPPANMGLEVQVVMLLAYALVCVFWLLLIAHLRYHRKHAFVGDTDAARKIILPAFEPLVWILAGVTAVYSLTLGTLLSQGLYIYYVPRIAAEIFHSGRRFVFLVVLVFMLQKSVSVPALRRAVLIAGVLATYNVPLAWFMVKYFGPTGELTYWTVNLARAAIVLLDIFVLVKPPARASKRRIREFCAFSLVYHMLLLTCTILYRTEQSQQGFFLATIALLWCLLSPLVIWRVLRADTEHWRGLGHHAPVLESLHRHSHGLTERISSEGL